MWYFCLTREQGLECVVHNQQSDRVYSIFLRREDLKSFHTMTTLCFRGLAQTYVDFPALSYCGLERSGSVRPQVQPCISSVWHQCAVNPGSVRSGKCVGGSVKIHAFQRLENKTYENLGAHHITVIKCKEQTKNIPYCVTQSLPSPFI